MAYVPIPKDLSRVKTKIVFNLTQRQLVCFASALAVGLPIFFGLRRISGTNIAALGMIAACVPFFLAAMVEKDGLPFERVLLNVLRLRFLRRKTRPYRTQNYYAMLMRQSALEKEVSAIVRTTQRNHSKPAQAGARSKQPQSGAAQAGAGGSATG